MKKTEHLKNLFPMWDALSDEQREAIVEETELRNYEKGHIIHKGDDDCAGLFLVHTGQLRAYILSEKGKQVTLYRLLPLDVCLFSASCVLNNIDFDIHIEAEKDCQIYVTPPILFSELLKSSLAVSDFTNQIMASRFTEVMWVMERMLFSSFGSRLAYFLIDQSAIDESDTITITHDDIARHLGSAREVVTKMLNYFEGEGLIKLSRGQIAILDSKKLYSLID